VDKEGNIYSVQFPGFSKLYQNSAAVAADASLGVVSRYELATGKATNISPADLFVLAAYSVTTNGKVVRALAHAARAQRRRTHLSSGLASSHSELPSRARRSPGR